MGGWGSRVLNFLVKIYAMFIWYSWPSLVVPYSEELFSRLFLDENQFWWVLQNRMSTENAVGCLFCLSRSLCLQLQQNTMVPIDVDGQICHFCSQGFVPWQILVVLNMGNPLENPATNTMGASEYCWSCKQKWEWEKNKQPTAFSVLIRFWSTHQNLFSPRNGQEISSSLFDQTRLGKL